MKDPHKDLLIKETKRIAEEKPLTLTVIIRNTEALDTLEEPIQYRTLHIQITKEQMRELSTNKYEEISRCFFETPKTSEKKEQ